jgi:hypothetical protein
LAEETLPAAPKKFNDSMIQKFKDSGVAGIRGILESLNFWFFESLNH